MPGPALQRLLDPVGDRAHEPVGQLGPLDLVLHDARAAARPSNTLRLERGGPRRVARAVDALERGDQQLVLVGVGEELDFVDGRHDAEHGTDARNAGDGRRTAPPILGQLVSVLCELSDGVEWGVHVCVLLAALPDDAALPAAKLAEYHGVPAAYLAKHLQALAGRGRARDGEGRARRLPAGAPAAEITVLDVVEAIDGDESAFRCTEIRRRGPIAMPAREYTKPCGIHRAFTRADEAWRAELATTTIADLFVGLLQRRAAGRARKGRPLAPGERALEPRRSLAAGARALAVVRLVAAGLELALLRLLAHRGLEAT